MIRCYSTSNLNNNDNRINALEACCSLNKKRKTFKQSTLTFVHGLKIKISILKRQIVKHRVLKVMTCCLLLVVCILYIVSYVSLYSEIIGISQQNEIVKSRSSEHKHDSVDAFNHRTVIDQSIQKIQYDNENSSTDYNDRCSDMRYEKLDQLIQSSVCVRRYNLSQLIPLRVYQATRCLMSNNPSIQPTDYGYIISLNVVRYYIDDKLDLKNAYIADWTIAAPWSRTIALQLNSNMTAYTDNSSKYPIRVVPWDKEEGGMDSRLIKHMDMTYLISAHGRTEHQSIRPLYSDTMHDFQYMDYQDEAGRDTATIRLTGYQDLNRNKNWMGFVFNSSLHFVHSFYPLVVLSCDVKHGDCEIAGFQDTVHSHHLPHVEMWHGGTPFILLPNEADIESIQHLKPIFDVSDSVYVGIVHEREPYWVYSHRFVVLSKLKRSPAAWIISGYSNLFHFQAPINGRSDFWIEFASGLYFENRIANENYKKLIITYGRNDTEANMILIDIKHVLNHLHISNEIHDFGYQH